MNRIDKLQQGQAVRLLFRGGDRTEVAIFLGIHGEGDARRARFVQAAGTDASGVLRSYEWEAYRFNGGWAYGSSAERLSLVEVF